MTISAGPENKTLPSEQSTNGMMTAVQKAKTTVIEMTGQTLDSLAQCHREEDGTWMISIDVIESLARMGDNDLLATYDLQIGNNLELLSYTRRRRYHREDMDG